MSRLYPPAPLLAGHPYFPVRLGYMRLLDAVRPDVARLLRMAKPFTLMSARNLTTIYREGQRILNCGIQGDFVEIGVHRGGSAGILASLIKQEEDRQLHLFDRWGDLPEPTERDGNRYDEYRRDRIPDKLATLRDRPPLDDVRQLVEEIIEFPPQRLHYYAGWYSDTLDDYSGGPIAFASLDCDYYESVKLALDFLDRHAAPSATIVADDYEGWPGAKAAIDEWLEKTRRKVRIYPLRIGPAVLRLQD
jgi:O-methyltransferase